jgi:hypothetical protein
MLWREEGVTMDIIGGYLKLWQRLQMNYSWSRHWAKIEVMLEVGFQNLSGMSYCNP